MEREFEKRFTRIEAKVNKLLKAMIYVLAIVIGYGVYFLFRENGLATVFGFAAAAISGGAFEWSIRGIEKRHPYED